MTEPRGNEQLSMSGRSTMMAAHPDIIELRQRYERVAETRLAQGIDALAFIGGMYAAISPWVVGFHGKSAALAVTDLIVGLGIALLAFGFAAAYERTHGLAAVVAAAGIWLIVAPWAVRNVDRTTGMLVSNIVVGACVLLLGGAAALLGLRGVRR